MSESIANEKKEVTYYNKMAIQILEITGKDPVGQYIQDIIKNEYLKKIITSSLEF